MMVAPAVFGLSFLRKLHSFAMIQQMLVVFTALYIAPGISILLKNWLA